MVKNCERCDGEFTRRSNEKPFEFAKRRFCGRECSHAHTSEARKGIARPQGAQSTHLVKCLECGVTIQKKPVDSWANYHKRKYCGHVCSRKAGIRARNEQDRIQREYVISELEFLIGTDTSENLAKRLGYHFDSLLANLRKSGRWNRPDLVEKLYEHSVEVSTSCPECQTRVRWSNLDQHLETCEGNGWGRG